MADHIPAPDGDFCSRIRSFMDSKPTAPPGCGFAALDTRTPYVLDFEGPEGGMNAHYLLRWVNTKGEKGPWSETATATVGA